MTLRTVVLVGLVWLVGSSSGLAASGPTVTLSAGVVAPGASVQVSAAGFAAGAALTISLDARTLGSAAADASGGLANVAVSVPADVSPGGHVVTVADAQSGAAAAAALVVQAPDPARVVDGSFKSAGVGRLRFDVYLPVGYQTSGERYPVIYFLHGLPADGLAFRAWTSFVASAMRDLDSRAIIVVPQAARGLDPDPEFLDWGQGRDWASALALELPRYLDAHFRTIADRRGRALIGVSAGGYGATMLGLRHLDRFSVLESWSGYFEPTDPSGAKRLDLGSESANAAATAYTFVPRLHALFRREPTFLGFYVGRQDDLFRTDNIRFHARLVAARVPHAFAVYAGGHETNVWSAHAGTWLGLALRHLSPAASSLD